MAELGWRGQASRALSGSVTGYDERHDRLRSVEPAAGGAQFRNGLDGHTPRRVRTLLAPLLGERLAARAASNLADYDVLVRRDRDTIAALTRALADGAPLLVPHLDEDVHDLAGLARVAGHLFG